MKIPPMIDDTLYAFPSLRMDRPGMSLRDYFAGQALAGMLSNPECISSKPAVAIHVYSFADAMLKAREVKP